MRNIQVLTAFADTPFVAKKQSERELAKIMDFTAQVFQKLGQTPEGQIAFKALKTQRGNDILSALMDEVGGIEPNSILGKKRGFSFPAPKM